jgi:hypothetical protein
MIKKANFDTAIQNLRNTEDYKVVLEYIREERERMLGDFSVCIESNSVMRNAGRISAIDELLQIIS